MSRLFTYGTLRVAELMEIVAGARLLGRSAVLEDHRQRLLRGEVYPGLLPAPGERVEGVLYDGLSDATLARIDRFEGRLYERREVDVVLASGQRCPAFVYALRSAGRALATDRAFSEADFRAQHLPAYRAACLAFAREVERECGAGPV